MSDDDALLDVLTLESREVAVACCDAAIRYLGVDEDRIDGQIAPRTFVEIDGRSVKRPFATRRWVSPQPAARAPKARL